MNRSPQKSRSFSRAAYEQHRATSDGGDSIRSDSAPPGAYFICPYQGGSHAEWPKDSHEHAPTQTGRITCCSPKAVDTEYRPPPVARVSKRPKKLRAISRVSTGGSPVGERRCGGELLPTRRTLFQIDVFEQRGDVEGVSKRPAEPNPSTSPHAPREPGGALVDPTLPPDELQMPTASASPRSTVMIACRLRLDWQSELSWSRHAALLQPYYEPLRHPKARGLSLAGFQLVVAPTGWLSLSTCCRHYPSAAAAGGPCTDWKASPHHGAHPDRGSFCLKMSYAQMTRYEENVPTGRNRAFQESLRPFGTSP